MSVSHCSGSPADPLRIPLELEHKRVRRSSGDSLQCDTGISVHAKWTSRFRRLSFPDVKLFLISFVLVYYVGTRGCDDTDEDGSPDALLPAQGRGRHGGLQLCGDQSRHQGLSPGRGQQGVHLSLPQVGRHLLQGGQGGPVIVQGWKFRQRSRQR